MIKHSLSLAAVIAACTLAPSSAASDRLPIDEVFIAPSVALSAPLEVSRRGNWPWYSRFIGSFFFASLDEAQVVPPTGSSARGITFMWLNPARDRLMYWILMDGIVLKEDFTQRTQPEDAVGIHIHVGAPGANGPHGLNVWGTPSEDDLEMSMYPSLGLVTGDWNDGDAYVANPGVGDTRLLTDHLTDLRAEDIYVQIHTVQFPMPGEIRGRVEMVW